MSSPATRMNLLASRSSMRLAVQGVELLKSKREALIKDFFGIIDTILTSREEMAREVAQSMTMAGLAKSFHGGHQIRAAALSARREIPLVTREINIWGIRIPEIHFSALRRSPEARGMLPIDTPPAVLETAESYEQLMERLLRTASQEIRLKRLGEEIRKVSRRINALEQTLIPSLRNSIRSMQDVLQEREREDLFRLKHIKNRRARELGR